MVHVTFSDTHGGHLEKEVNVMHGTVWTGWVEGTLRYQDDFGQEITRRNVWLDFQVFEKPRKLVNYLNLKSSYLDMKLIESGSADVASAYPHPDFSMYDYSRLANDLHLLVAKWVDGDITPEGFRYLYSRPTPWAVRVAKYDADAAEAKDEWAYKCFNALYKDYPIKLSEYQPWERRSVEEANRDAGPAGPGKFCAARASAKLALEWTERDWETIRASDEELRARKRKRLEEMDAQRAALAAEIKEEDA